MKFPQAITQKAFIALAIFILFKGTLDHYLIKFLINPVFGRINEAHILYDIAAIFLAISFVVPITKKILNGATFPPKYLAACMVTIIIYLSYRFQTPILTFIPTSFSSQLMISDLIPISLFIVTWVALYENGAPRFREKKQDFSGFIMDKAIIIKPENDIYFREKFVHHLAKLIAQTDTRSGALTIGIVAPWGTGKTSFYRV